jgi:hypothetical protein
MPAAARHRIDDLGTPRLPVAIRAINALGGGVAERLAVLDEDALCSAARRRAGSFDLGPDGFRMPLRVLLRALTTKRTCHRSAAC